MYVRASVTVENCVIIPVFILIFMSLITITGYYHDRLIIKGAVELSAVKLEQLPDDEKSAGMDVIRMQVKEYISEKTLFMKDVFVDAGKKNGAYVVSCQSDFPVPFVKEIMGKQVTESSIGDNDPCTLIRYERAAREVMEE